MKFWIQTPPFSWRKWCVITEYRFRMCFTSSLLSRPRMPSSPSWLVKSSREGRMLSLTSMFATTMMLSSRDYCQPRQCSTLTWLPLTVYIRWLTISGNSLRRTATLICSTTVTLVRGNSPNCNQSPIQFFREHTYENVYIAYRERRTQRRSRFSRATCRRSSQKPVWFVSRIWFLVHYALLPPM